MGVFSWKTSDTKKSISISLSNQFPVSLILPDNTRFIEFNYEGYGVFGGKDVYEVIAQLNGKHGRHQGINLIPYFNGKAEFKNAFEKKGILCPKLAENLEANYDDLDFPERCPDQGLRRE